MSASPNVTFWSARPIAFDAPGASVPSAFQYGPPMPTNALMPLPPIFSAVRSAGEPSESSEFASERRVRGHQRECELDVRDLEAERTGVHPRRTADAEERTGVARTDLQDVRLPALDAAPEVLERDRDGIALLEREGAVDVRESV